MRRIAHYENKRDCITEGLHSKQPDSGRGIVWSFLDVEEATSGLGDFFTGYLAKYRPKSSEEVALPELGIIDDASISNRIIAKARFFLHVHTGLIAFHPVSSQINIEAFRSHFATLFEGAFGGFFVSAEVQMIQDEYEILKLLSEFSSITEVRICLHPSNPNLTEMWKDVDVDLKEMGVDEYTEVLVAGRKSPSLNVATNASVRSKLAMAVDGYGRGTVTGSLEGKEKTVRTSDNPVSVRVADGDGPTENLLLALSATFRRIMDRFQKD